MILSLKTKIDSMNFNFESDQGWHNVIDKKADELMIHLLLYVDKLFNDGNSVDTLIIDGLIQEFKNTGNWQYNCG